MFSSMSASCSNCSSRCWRVNSSGCDGPASALAARLRVNYLHLEKHSCNAIQSRNLAGLTPTVSQYRTYCRYRFSRYASFMLLSCDKNGNLKILERNQLNYLQGVHHHLVIAEACSGFIERLNFDPTRDIGVIPHPFEKRIQATRCIPYCITTGSTTALSGVWTFVAASSNL